MHIPLENPLLMQKNPVKNIDKELMSRELEVHVVTQDTQKNIPNISFTGFSVKNSFYTETSVENIFHSNNFSNSLLDFVSNLQKCSLFTEN